MKKNILLVMAIAIALCSLFPIGAAAKENKTRHNRVGMDDSAVKVRSKAGNSGEDDDVHRMDLEEFYAAAECVIEECEYLGEAKVINCNEWVSLRDTADASSLRLAKVPKGEVVDAFYYSDVWTICFYDDNVGFIRNEYLALPAQAAKTDKNSGYWPNGIVNASLDYYDEFERMYPDFRPYDDNTYASTYDTDGWTITDLITTAGGACYKVTGRHEVEVLAEARKGEKVLRVFEPGDYVYVLGSWRNWYLCVLDASGDWDASGWVDSSALSYYSMNYPKTDDARGDYKRSSDDEEDDRIYCKLIENDDGETVLYCWDSCGDMSLEEFLDCEDRWARDYWPEIEAYIEYWNNLDWDDYN